MVKCGRKRKKEEGRRKKEEGRRKREEGEAFIIGKKNCSGSVSLPSPIPPGARRLCYAQATPTHYQFTKMRKKVNNC
jgi:hypothetical protein